MIIIIQYNTQRQPVHFGQAHALEMHAVHYSNIDFVAPVQLHVMFVHATLHLDKSMLHVMYVHATLHLDKAMAAPAKLAFLFLIFLKF